MADEAFFDVVLVFRSKFSYIHREHSPQPRRFHCYFTSVTVGVIFSTYLEMCRSPCLAVNCVDVGVGRIHPQRVGFWRVVGLLCS